MTTLFDVLPADLREKLEQINAKEIEPTNPLLIEKWVSAVQAKGYHWAYVIPSFGPHVLALARTAYKEAAIVCIDTDLAHIRGCLEEKDYSELFTPRLVMITSLDRPDIGKWVCAIGDRLSRSVLLCPKLHVDKLDEACQALLLLAEHADVQVTALNTQALNATTTYNNVMGNLHASIRTTPIDPLKDRFKDAPAIVVAAGPSLERDLDSFGPPTRANYVLIATIPTLKPLLQRRIVPDFCVALDYHEISARFLEDLPDEAKKVHYIYEPKVNPAVTQNTPADAKISFLANDWEDALFGLQYPSRGPLPAGATVAHLGFFLAQHLGCAPIAMVGLDLAFQKHYYPACVLSAHPWKGTNEEIIKACVERGNIRPIEGQDGKEWYTDSQMLCYLLHFETIWKAAPQKVYDCTGAGAKREGATPETLEGFICRECDIILDPQAFGYDWQHAPEPSAPHIEALTIRLGQIELLGPLIEEAIGYYSDYEQKRGEGKHDKALMDRKINGVLRRMSCLGGAKELLEAYDGATQLRSFWGKTDIQWLEQSGADADQVFAAKFKHDFDFLRGLRGAQKNLAQRLEKTLDEVKTGGKG